MQKSLALLKYIVTDIRHPQKNIELLTKIAKIVSIEKKFISLPEETTTAVWRYDGAASH